MVILREPKAAEPPAETGKRKYTKGPRWHARQNKAKEPKPVVDEKPPAYWQGYRQAVMDGAPRLGRNNNKEMR